MNARCWLLMGVLVLVALRAPRAEYDPAFEMDSCVGEADLIVSGYLDRNDTLTVTNCFFGQAGAATIRLGEWGRRFRRIAQPDRWWEEPPFWKRAWRWIVGPHDVELVGFLRMDGHGGWSAGGSSWSFVPLRGDGAYPFDGFAYNEGGPLYRRARFFTALEEAVRTKAERTKMLASPRRLERSSDLITLALTHEPLPGPPFGFWFVPFYHLSEIAKDLANPSAEEEELLLHALRDAQTQAEKVNALRLIALVPLTSRAFDALIPYIDRAQAAGIRRAAIGALAAVGGVRAIDLLGPLLTRDEPELNTVLQSLPPSGAPGSEAIRSVALVDRLTRLAKEFETDVPRQGDAVLDTSISNQLSLLHGKLACYPHPRFLPMLVESSRTTKVFAPGQARNILHEITGLEFPAEDRQAWQRWWESARQLLEPDYDLETAAGRAAWIAAWSEGDAATQRLLGHLWLFEPALEPARALLDEAPESGATIAALSMLWDHQRLSPEIEKSIVEHYVSFTLVEHEPPYPQQQPTYRDVVIISKTAFDFPQTTEVQYRGHVSIGADDVVQHLGSWRDSGVTTLAGRSGTRWSGGGGEVAGAPIARGVLEMRSVEYVHDRKIRWTASWKLEPIQLREIPQ